MSEEMRNMGYHSAWIQEVAFEITKEMKYNPKCLCGNTCCARHSNCRACMAFHKLTDHPPTCRYKWNKREWDSR
ncbi:MAG: hypothetical protein A2144_01560 [Chloroflexi bacterium RBG_16_50_9]|nr:MAG: hypothetical protein A2144_01560 [Chloroflexi bacterium RBG_16_50_9]